MMPGGEQREKHPGANPHHPHAGHHPSGNNMITTRNSNGPAIQQPIPQHAAPRHPAPWASPQYYHSHHPCTSNGNHSAYLRDGANTMMPQGSSMMPHDGGYSLQPQPPPQHHMGHHPMHAQQQHSPVGNYYSSPSPYYGQPMHAAAPHHTMNHPPPGYYSPPYNGGPIHTSYPEYDRRGQQILGYNHNNTNMSYYSSPNPPDHRMAPNSQYPHSNFMHAGMEPPPGYNNGMYPSDPHCQRLPFNQSSSFSVDSRSTMGNNNDPIAPPASNNRQFSFPSHVGLRSIASDSTSKTPSPPGIPPPPPPPVIHEPHEISAPSSLDETEGGGPLRHSTLVVNRHDNHSARLIGSLPPEMGSSEKKETLDTASVLLAFSSTKKRPSSTTSTLDDTDALSLATMSTIPHSVAPPDHGHSVTFCPPTDYPKRLTMPEDKERLNQLHCFMRSDLLELVVIQPSEGTKETDSFAKIPTSTDPRQIGRVGLRCVHCSMSPDGGRTGPSMSIFYPKSIGEIYRLVTSWKRCHLNKCKNIPKSVREELGRLNEVKARGKTSYWTESAAQLGLINMPTKIGGICFSPDHIGRSLTPTKMSGTVAEQTTVTADTHSPESLPTISDASTLVAKEVLIQRVKDEETKV